ncbi:CD209 antigen-like protein E [Dicentrarchus labrax]|uniref:C-type lectin domain-containing protein n=1 Tax=Dicentrarchus labrax TaxID=13489 RepID=A0A8C4H1N3_DICLA|nr:CD209 antigen-like protein E [Dicentrarchus labrax]
MSEAIYDNDPIEQNQMEEIASNTTGERDVEERIVCIYKSLDIYGGQQAVTQSAVHQQPRRTLVRAMIVCLVLLCVLLLAGIIGTGLHCRIKLPSHNESWSEERKQALAELSHFCKDGCTSFNNSFYYISSKQESWANSRQDCKDRGADLVVVKSEEEQIFINSLNRIFWIGLTDREEKGTWKWVDGSVLNSTGFWKKGEASGISERMKHCVVTYYYNHQRSWSDEKCSKSQSWICEKVIDL